jgi:VWFA-related protein
MILHRRSVVAAFLLLAVVAVPAIAQQTLPPTGDTIDVSIVNVDVFVTDRKGKRVAGLTPADFEIRENGHVQPITNFAEYTPDADDVRIRLPNGDLYPAAPAPAVKRTILVFVERFSLPTFRTEPMFASIRKTLRSVVRPGDSAAVVYWDNDSAFTLQNFTDDVPSLEAALKEIEHQSTGVPGSAELMRRRAFARAFLGNLPSEKIAGLHDLESVDDWDLQANGQFGLFRFEHKTEELLALMRSMADVDGRKIVIFATNDFGLYPTASGVPTGSAPVAALSHLETEKYRDAVARTANEHGITVYPVYPVGLEWTPSASAVESRSDINTINRHQDAQRNARDFEVLTNQTRALDELAKETGGLMASGSRDIVSLLPRVAEDLNRYYSIAYRTPATGTTASRDISVKTKNRNYVVRSRREYVEKTDVTRMQDRVIANLYRPDAKGAIPVHVDLGKIDKASRNRWSVPVQVTIPVNALSVDPEGKGTFSVFVATGGVLGIMSDVQQRTQAYTAAELSGREHITYELTLTFNGAASVVSVGVMDAGSKDFGLKTVDLPLYRAEDQLGSE